MLVDDHALVRSAVRQALSAPDVTLVAEAGTAEEALDVAPRVRPDVLLVDIDLPAMDGLRLVRELATRLPDTRIVMLTVSTAERDVIDAMRFGASGYLTKDLSPEALLRAVRGVHAGELAMPRWMAARVIRRLLATARHRSPVADEDPALASLSAREAGGAATARRRPHGPRDRRRPVDLAADGREPRRQHPREARRPEPRRGGRTLPRGHLARRRPLADGGAAAGPRRGPRGRDLDSDEPRPVDGEEEAHAVAQHEEEVVAREVRLFDVAERERDDESADEDEPWTSGRARRARPRRARTPPGRRGCRRGSRGAPRGRDSPGQERPRDDGVRRDGRHARGPVPDACLRRRELVETCVGDEPGVSGVRRPGVVTDRRAPRQRRRAAARR